jgi:hypothetical protein
MSLQRKRQRAPLRNHPQQERRGRKTRSISFSCVCDLVSKRNTKCLITTEKPSQHSPVTTPPFFRGWDIGAVNTESGANVFI